jgi:hypothetical protein
MGPKKNQLLRNLSLAFDMVGFAVLMQDAGWYMWKWDPKYLIHDHIEGERLIGYLAQTVWMEHYQRWIREDGLYTVKDI